MPATAGLALPTNPAAALLGAAAAATPSAAESAADPAAVSVVPPPPAPVAIAATSGRGMSRVSWEAEPKGAGLAGYDLFVGGSPGAESSVPVNGAALITGKSFDVTGLTNGVTYYFVVRAVGSGGLSAPSNEISATPGNGYRGLNALATPVLSAAAVPAGSGYFEANAQGAVTNHGGAPDEGSTDEVELGAPIRQVVSTPDGNGYWMVAADGGVFAFGDAGYYGSMAGQSLAAPMVGLAPTANGDGYWEVSADGGVFAFGDAAFAGSMGGQPLAAPVTGITASPTGGYWLVSADGGVYSLRCALLGFCRRRGRPLSRWHCFDSQWFRLLGGVGRRGCLRLGSATFYGSAANLHLAAPVVGITADAATGGYWLVAGDGGMFSFNAPFYGAG